MAKIAKGIIVDPITETIDLAKVSPAKGDELIKLAFKEPFSLAKQIRITFIVGAGKLGRQKYDPTLTKTLCTALETLGFNQDPGASCVNNCQGKFKHQHDTGQNLMYLHVFPKLSAAATSAAPAAAAASTASKSTHEDQIINCNMKDFEDILRRHCTTWLQRRRCLQVLESFNSKLQSIEDKMCLSQLVSQQEKELYGETDRDLVQDKMKAAQAGMKTLVQAQNIGADAKDYLIKQVTDKISKIQSVMQPQEADSTTAALSSKQLAAAQKKIAALTARREVIAAISPVGPPALTHERDMMGVWHNVLRLKEKKKDSAEQRAHFEDLAESSRRWFETDEGLKARVKQLQARCKPSKGRGKKAGGGGKKKKKSSGRAPGSGYRSRMKQNYE